MEATLCQYVGFLFFDRLPSRLRPGSTTEEDEGENVSDNAGAGETSAP